MPLTVNRYQVNVGQQDVWMPKDAKVLSVGQDDPPTPGGFGSIFLNALVDASAPTELRAFVVCGTGWYIDIGNHELGAFVGTASEFHVFEVLG